MKQVIRIIGGLYRGKKIHFPAVEGLRPTPDRVKETLFNWLMHDIKDARCLDAFAGSGSLGFEAFSRGASKVVLVERSLSAHNNLQKIIKEFNSSNLQLIKEDARTYLQQSREQYDLIFLDPPFAENYLPSCVQSIVKNNLLIKGGLLYLETPEEIELAPEHWKLIKLKRVGQVVSSLFEKL
ncbi:16S rRNA (guanine(966)-N(2))-methyltransferase RsmD [Legionella sp. km772]|uniref:16S rRNA (guanine(966)-N(2))-methyltransferase RsmD n=1 Tax=Legionella sp. km772 TaxID=2498111 RepID=UPI000F8D2CC1|nr:16S rRNA (guanine(966)-N(2))-methyltransferase RsmD [Legionella sp. km772]RUR13670.1 16S rRNA (guanine(966)-N(2))-methyltransferase RsmD [Legionella sp. km772]